jgi:DNA-directed RNA polymerase specialized sigma24 family protein
MEIAVALTKESLEKLLLWLDQDRKIASEKYETLRLGLVRFFEWRGCVYAEDLADEVIDRVARRIAEGEEVRNIYSYGVGVARFVFLETMKEREKQQAVLRQLRANPVRGQSPGEDAQMECLRKCLQSLPAESSGLLMAYYQDKGRNKIEARKKLAEQWGVSQQTFRMRLQRLRAKLEECVTDCIHREGGSS